ncbi:HEAT repeat domain-containing protein [Streptomyces echinatus]|uniref:HEAT repeat protein n=3 Tax=Streptomyces echinatus TaxID=67293 RepID=A0A7W9PRH9_9ACTN|nr:HEAT repeat protein [Streptomyces echinatus]
MRAFYDEAELHSLALSACLSLGDYSTAEFHAHRCLAALRPHMVRSRVITTTRLAHAQLALRAFGPAAAGAQELIRSLTTATDAHIRPAAVAALWTVGGDLTEAMPHLLGLLDDDITFAISDAADLLAEIGPPASVSLPRLRDLLTHDYEWVRVHCAAALWEIGGEAEVPAVLETLLQAMAQNPATANQVVACLNRMGPLAAPALPLLREQLALPRRGGRLASIDHDEELQGACRTLIARLDPPPPGAPAARTA